MGLVIVGEEKVAVWNPTSPHHAWQGNIKVDLTDHGIALPLTMSSHLIVDRLNKRKGTFDALMQLPTAHLTSTPAALLWAGDNDLYYIRILSDSWKDLSISPLRRINRFLALSTDTELMLKVALFIDQNTDATIEEVVEFAVNHTDVTDDVSYHLTKDMARAVENWNA